MNRPYIEVDTGGGTMLMEAMKDELSQEEEPQLMRGFMKFLTDLIKALFHNKSYGG